MTNSPHHMTKYHSVQIRVDSVLPKAKNTNVNISEEK